MKRAHFTAAGDLRNGLETLAEPSQASIRESFVEKQNGIDEAYEISMRQVVCTRMAFSGSKDIAVWVGLMGL